MRSVRAKILIWCFGTLLLSLVAFVAVSFYFASHSMGHAGFDGTYRLVLGEATESYESGGVPKLAAFIKKLDRLFPDRWHLTDAHGRDLVTGEDRSALLGAMPSQGHPHEVGGLFVVVFSSRDGRYRIISTRPRTVDLWNNLPYYGLILLAVALLCWALAVNLASPLRDLARVVDRFGAGDLAARANLKRKDEIGDLSRAFDRMAERIGTLLTAERRLLQDISHELRSPLARLSFAAELVRTAEDGDAAVERLRKEIARLTSLVGALIEVTRVEGDPEASQREQVRLDELLTDVAEDCRLEAEARGCGILLQAPAEVAVHGDHELLRRAVENVVRNSVRYSPKDSSVDIKLEATSDTAHISVRDYGPGVPEEALSKIFQPFFRVDVARGSATGGMGLGLAIAHRAVSVHHGQLWARNAQPGLEVWMELPLVG